MKKIFSIIIAAAITMGGMLTAWAEPDYIFSKDYNKGELSGEVTSKLGSAFQVYGTSEGTYDPANFYVEQDTDGNRYLKMQGSAFMQQATGFTPMITEDVGVFETITKFDINTTQYQVKINYESQHAEGYIFTVSVPEKFRGTSEWLSVKIIFTSEGRYMIMINDDIISPMSQSAYDTIKKLFNDKLYYYRIIHGYKNGEKSRFIALKNIYVYSLPQADISESNPAEGEDWVECDVKIDLTISGDVDAETLKNINLKKKDGEDVSINIGELTDDGKLLIEPVEALAENTEYVLDFGGVLDIYGLGLKTKQLTFTTKIENPEPTGVEISGKTRVQIKDNTKATYSVTVLNERGTTQGLEQKAEWSLGGDYSGVSISDGILKITSEAKAGNIEIIATAGDVSDSITVYLDDVDVSLLEDVVKRTEQVLQSGTEFDIEKTDALNEKVIAAHELINKEVRTQNEVDTLSEELEAAVMDLIKSAFGLPVAEGVKLEGEPVEGVGYTVLADVEADESVTVKESQYSWFVGYEEDFKKISETSSKYSFNKEDYGKTIYAEITPQYEYFGFIINGDSVKTEVKNAPSLPEVSDVKITGTAKVGNTLGVTYKFYHKEGYVDNGSVIEWKDSAGTVLGTGENYKLTSGDLGKYIKASVTPVTDKAPTTGETVESDSVKIAAKSTGGSGGSGGGSIGGNYGITSTYTETAKETIEAEPKEEIKSKFTDIEGHWAEKSIIKMYEAGYVNGVSDELFVPDKEVTRAEFIAMLVRMMGIKAEDNGYFSDVLKDAWYSEPASAAYEHGIITGSEGKFRPDSIVTREEMAKMVVNVYECLANEKINAASSDFTDYDLISDWAKEYVNKAFEKGFIKGMSDGTFSPKSGTTRAQAVVVLERLRGMLN